MSDTDPHAADARGGRAAALAGVLSAAAGVAVGDAVAAPVGAWPSPVVAVGDRVVDAVPRPVKDLAITLFGTADKLALLVGIGVVLALVAALVGVVARDRRTAGLVATAGVGLAGVAAALADPAAPVSAVVPGVASGVVAVSALAGLLRRRFGRPHAPGRRSTDGAGVDRRGFLRAAGLTAAVAAVAAGTGRVLTGARGAAVDRVRAALGLPTPTSPARVVDVSAVTVGVDGVTPFVTDTDAFYRIDTRLDTPALSREGWTLTVDGMVDRPLELTLDQLGSRYEVLERTITLTCVSNEIGGDLLGTATWLGVRVSEVLEDAGVRPGADQLVGRAFDGFTTGYPVARAFDRDAMLVVGMNGEPLPAAHGFPLRMVVPGLYGYVSATKWLTNLELTTFDAHQQYWVERGWSTDAPIKTQSRIDVPAGLARVPRGVVPVAGVAWAQTRGIRAVEVRVDDGPWRPAELAEAYDDVTWRQWVWRWDTTSVSPGRHTLTVRATDGTGRVQTDARVTPFPDGATGRHRVVVLVADG